MSWAAGIQYDGDIFRANHVLGNLSTFYPGQKCYEVAGFFWWQGDKDSRDMGLASHYEENLVALIKSLRVQYDSPKAKVTTPCIECFPLAVWLSLAQSCGSFHLGGRVLISVKV